MPNLKVPNDKFDFSMQTEEFKSALASYKSILEKDPLSTQQQIIELLGKELSLKYGFSAAAGQHLAAKVIKEFLSPEGEAIVAPGGALPELTTSKIIITLEDYNKFVEFVRADPKIDDASKSLLLAFIVFYRKNYHKTGWIRYDKKSIFHLAGLSKLSFAKQEAATKYLHNHYDLNMRVIGANQPIACFTLPWLQDEKAAGSSENPYITLEDFSPEGLQKILAKI